MASTAALYAFLCPVYAIAQDAPANAAPTAAASTAALQPRTENGRQIYDAAQFVQFTPQNGNDIISRIPGFDITEASNNRGLGEATQNVLFNGQRISGKSNDARSVLGRTPASTILRIEIADGAVFNIPGLTGQVANIVTKTTGITGNYSYKTLFRKNVDPQYFSAEIGIAGKLGKGDFTLGLKNGDQSYRGGGVGFERVTREDGTLLYSNQRLNKFTGDTPVLSGSFSRKSDAGSVFNSNVEMFYERERRLQTFDRTTLGEADIFDRSTGKGYRVGAELSADYEFALGGGRLKLVGLQSLARYGDDSIFRREEVGELPTGSLFKGDFKEGESVARAEYRWKMGKADLQVSFEGAYNFLDVKSDLFTLDNAGIFQPETFDNGNSRVSEKRGQIIGSYGCPIAKYLTLQTQFGAEYNQISQTGARGLTRQFIRPKGSVSLAWKASSVLDINARFERKVGQLDFGDFVASVDLRDANNNAGNVRLVPPQSWLASLEFNRNLKAAGSVKLKLEREWISDIVDQIAIDGGGEAPGNLDKASRWSAEFNGTILLDPIGIKGAKFTLSGYLQRGRLRDQITGLFRPINSERRYTYEINFRHDIAGKPLAYGVILDDQQNADFLRLNFISEQQNDKPNMRAYIEHKKFFGMRFRFALINLLRNKETYRQTFYTERRNGPIDRIRQGSLSSGIFARIALSGTF